MPTYVGFNTIDQFKKFTLTDFELIKRDLLNALNIRQGEKPGLPGYGTSIWTLVFEPQTETTAKLAQEEIQRVVAQDPRIFISDITVYPQENGLLIELQVTTIDGTQTDQLIIQFDQQLNRAQYV